MDAALIESWQATLEALVGPEGTAEDAGIMAAQMTRALAILSRPEIASGSLFEREPSSHAAALIRLAPVEIA